MTISCISCASLDLSTPDVKICPTLSGLFVFPSQNENGQEEWQAIFSPENFYKTNSVGSET
jgi:hypothetical protein